MDKHLMFLLVSSICSILYTMYLCLYPTAEHNTQNNVEQNQNMLAVFFEGCIDWELLSFQKLANLSKAHVPFHSMAQPVIFHAARIE